ncbi:MAG: FkbM family methyltransferase [Candidatus Shapirobacteria bacterium]
MKKYLELLNNYSAVFLFWAMLSQIKRTIWREKILGSYSQDYEDIEIEKLMNCAKGRYLEIGGYHPTRLSNTYRLYKKGWTGVIVEPNPEVKEIFKVIRSKDKFLNIGISENGGNIKYYKYLIPALNSFAKINNGHKITSVENIETRKITDIVKENFDFVSIDTEGYDAIILNNWPWKKYNPKVICVETDKVAVDKILKKQGYQLKYQNQFNSIYYF